MVILWCGLLLLTHSLSLVHPLVCNTDQYEWPMKNLIRCCNKCDPGHYMKTRCMEGPKTTCKQCPTLFYMDEYNNEMQCKRCSQCTKEHMVYKENCSKDKDAVCGCESGFECNSKLCEYCVKIPTTATTATTITATTATTTTATTTTVTSNIKTDEQQTTPTRDTVWILSLCCACVCILLTCIILISRHTPACGRIIFASAGRFWAPGKSSAESSQCTVDEEVPMPVQEVCGHKEWQEEV